MQEQVVYYQQTRNYIYVEDEESVYTPQNLLVGDQEDERITHEMEDVIRTTYIDASSPRGGHSPVTLSPVTPHTEDLCNMATLVKMVGAYEQDPCKQSGLKFQASLQELTTSLQPRCDKILTRMRALEHAQRNAFEDITIEERELVYFVAMAQSCKTGSIIFCVWKAGILKNMPSVLLSFNRLGETEKFSNAALKFNDIVKKCAIAMGLSEEKAGCVPLVKVFTEKKASSKLYGSAVRRMGEMRLIEEFSESYTIPLMVVMTNSQKIQKLRSDVKHLSRSMGVDSMGAMKALLIMDEAELTVKAGTKVKNAAGVYESKCAGLETELNMPVHLRQPSPVRPGEEDGHIPRKMPSMCEAFTSILRVTATPHAFAYKTDVTDKARVMVVADPSSNYWAFRKTHVWTCKTITRKEATSSNEMIDEMGKVGLGNRHGMVMVSKGSESTARTQRQKEMAKDCAKYVKGRGSESGFLSVAWDGKGVNIYTSCTTISGNLSEDKSYEEDKESIGVRHFKSNKSYPDFMSDMVFLQESSLPSIKTVLYSYCMSGRSTPIKSSCHKLSLTDIYVNLSGQGGHDEAIIQAMGRLNGVDERPQSMGKFVWGSASVLNHLYSIVSEVPYYVEKIMNGQNITTILLDVACDASVARTGGYVQDEQGCSSRTHGKRTRAGICEEAGKAEKEMRKILKKRKVTPVAPSFVHDFEGIVEMGVVSRSANMVQTRSRSENETLFLALLASAPDRTMTIDEIRMADPSLGNMIKDSHNHFTAEIVNRVNSPVERVRRGVFRLVGQV